MKITKALEQFVSFMGRKLSPAMHQVYASFYRMAIIGGWEKTIVGGVVLLLALLISGLITWLELSHADADGTGFIVAVPILLIAGGAGLGFLLAGISQLADPQFSVIQMLVNTATGN